MTRFVTASEPYYRRDLARVHHLGYGFHADACAPGILVLLEPIRDRRGLVLELGCGSGLLTRHLIAAGHRVIATDASPAMLELAREVAHGAESIRRLRLPDDPLTRPGGGRLRRSTPIGKGSFAVWWSRCLAEAGVRYRNPHTARHTFATRWLRRGGRLETLSLVMGHANIATTHTLYAHLDTSDILIDVARIDALT